MSQPRDLSSAITCVIPTFNSAEVIERCLRSIPSEVAVVVADNASRDDTAAIARTARSDATVIVRDSNGGFAQACNSGAAAARTDYVTFVNPDLVIGAGALNAIVEAAEADRSIAILGSSDAIESQATKGSVSDASMVSGAFLTVRREAFPGLELFDAAFFMYFEDYDLCVRAALAGSRVVVVDAAHVEHSHGKSTAARFDSELEKSWLWGAACQYFAYKYAGISHGAIAARKLRNYRRKAVFYRLLGKRNLAALLRARVEGAATVRRCGPEAMHKNGFVTGNWRTET